MATIAPGFAALNPGYLNPGYLNPGHEPCAAPGSAG